DSLSPMPIISLNPGTRSCTSACSFHPPVSPRLMPTPRHSSSTHPGTCPPLWRCLHSPAHLSHPALASYALRPT
ncbi:hypothetical protein C0993_009367, partial [Termitomyces sp. T159_Od127]